MTNEWDEAARKAAEEIQNEYGDDYLSVKFLSEIIAKHFAELKATHEALVELAVQLSIVYSHDKEIRDKIEALKLLVPMLSDPLVKAEIERSKG